LSDKAIGLMRSTSIIALVVLFLVAGLIFWSFKRATPVTVVDTRLERIGGLVRIEGTLRNDSAQPTAIDVEVHYYDRSGRAIGQNEVSVPNIPAGGVRQFRTPELSLSDVANFSLYLNHGRNPYGN
jgi:hypothetical protein